MKITAGQKAKIFCLSDKPEGKVISVGDKTVTIEIDRGLLTVDLDDIIESEGSLHVLNYTDIKEKKEKPEKSIPEKFADDMMNTVKALDKADKDPKNLYEVFIHYVQTSVKKNGDMFPLPCVFRAVSKEGKSGIALAGLALPREATYSAVMSIIKKQETKELIFGTNPENSVNGGIDPKYKFVFCIFRMKNNKWMYGVMGYNNNKDFQAEPDWNNPYWTGRMKALLVSAGLPTTDTIGTAYDKKIQIKKWLETPNGYFYEGDIIEKNLDEKTKAFLKNNNLNPNDREQIMKFFEDKDMKLDFKFFEQKQDDLFGMDMLGTGSLGLDTLGTGNSVNLMVTNTGFIFMDRKSKTRAILEAIESVARKTADTITNAIKPE